jgi:hypothetical protein
MHDNMRLHINPSLVVSDQTSGRPERQPPMLYMLIRQSGLRVETGESKSGWQTSDDWCMAKDYKPLYREVDTVNLSSVIPSHLL